MKTKVIIFTKYRDTMRYVADQLETMARFSDLQVFTLDGTLNEIQRNEVFIKFGEAPKAVLIATDAISEGINLQQYASQVIHYELPWNPNRLEQRNGRVDRFGQKAPEVKIRTLVLDETLDATILKVLIQKSNQIRHDYGFSPPYFGDETSVLDLIHEHGMSVKAGFIQPNLFETVESIDKADDSPFSEEVLERIKHDSFYGQTDLSLSFIQEQIAKTYHSIGKPDAIERFVQSGLSRFNCAITTKPDNTFKISLQHPDLKLPGIPDIIQRATFDPNKGLDDPDIEVLDLGHPLVRRLMDLIKQETFNLEGGSYGRSAAMLTNDVLEMTAVLTLLVRFVTLTTPVQIFEDLVTLAFPVYSDKPYDESKTAQLIIAQPAAGHLTHSEVSETLAEILERDDLNSLIENRVQTRKEEVMTDRKAFRQSLNRDIAWLADTDKIDVGSWDILAINILWPAGEGV